MVPIVLKRRLAVWLAGALLAAAGWVAISRTAPTGPPGAPRRLHDIPFTDVAAFGVNVFLEREADLWARRKTVQMASAAHLRWAKQQFPWYELEPENGRFEFAKYDDIVNLLRAGGLEVIARLDYPPAWVKRADWVDPDLPAGEANYPPADYGQYARYAGRVAEHFKGRVRFYQVWNEPNLLSEWGFNPAHPVSPTEYAALLGQAAQAIRTADPDAVILSAPLAYTTESTMLRGNMSDLDFLAGLYAAGAAADFDVLSANAFGFDQPPSADPAPDRLNFRRVELQRRIMESGGDAETPVWINEYGWNAAPAAPNGDASPWRRVSSEAQAAYTVEGMRWADTRWPWCGPLNVWFLRRERTLEGPDRYFALVDPDFTPQRAYDALRAAATDAGVAFPGTWEERSAPVRTQEPRAGDCRAPDCVDWRWRFVDRAGGADGSATRDGNMIVASRAGAALTFRFVGERVSVRARAGTDAGSFEVEVDGERQPAASGAASVVLTSATPEWRTLELAHGLGTGIHELKLTVGRAGGEVAIDRFEVAAGAGTGDPLRPWRWLLGASAACFLLLAWLDARRIGRRLASGA